MFKILFFPRIQIKLDSMMSSIFKIVRGPFKRQTSICIAFYSFI